MYILMRQLFLWVHQTHRNQYQFKLIIFFQVKVCSSKGEKIDISSYKDKFRLASGQYTGTITVQCNSGNSCFKFEGEFKRGK